MLRVLDIVPGTSVDGPGLRTSIYFAGCAHACPACHNPQSHDMNGGVPMTVDEILARVLPDEENVTFTGGDPFYQPEEELVDLARSLREAGRTIWVYTGFLYEQVSRHPLLDYSEVLVDGPYIDSERDITLLFRGSRNQRLVDLRRSTPDNVIEWLPDF